MRSTWTLTLYVDAETKRLQKQPIDDRCTQTWNQFGCMFIWEKWPQFFRESHELLREFDCSANTGESEMSGVTSECLKVRVSLSRSLIDRALIIGHRQFN